MSPETDKQNKVEDLRCRLKWTQNKTFLCDRVSTLWTGSRCNMMQQRMDQTLQQSIKVFTSNEIEYESDERRIERKDCTVV
jgi:hypothetical protein